MEKLCGIKVQGRVKSSRPQRGDRDGRGILQEREGSVPERDPGVAWGFLPSRALPVEHGAKTGRKNNKGRTQAKPGKESFYSQLQNERVRNRAWTGGDA